jgi:hypothetical protein
MAASRRKGWGQLSEKYRARLTRAGISQSDYERGRSIAHGRGHLETPEHGKKQAIKHPERYRKYLAKQEPAPKGRSAEDEAYELNDWRDKAYANEYRELHEPELLRYNDATVVTRIYGGYDDSGREHPGHSLYEAKWTAGASQDQLRTRARPQDEYNPWWYH